MQTDKIKPYTSLLEVFDLFTDDYGQRRQLELRSKRNYLTALNNYMNWLKAHGIREPQCRHVNIENMKGFLKTRDKIGDGTFKTQHSYYNVFFDWLVKKEYIPTNPMDEISIRKTNNKVRKKAFLTEDRIPEFVEIAGRKHPRDQAMFVYACQAGRRPSEVTALRVGDLFPPTAKYKHGYYWVTEKKKNGKRLRMPMTATMRKIFDWWLEEYRKLAVAQFILKEGDPLPEDWKVFPPFFRGTSKRLNPLGEMTTFSDMVSDIAKEMGIYHDGFGGHALRRAGAMLVYTIGGGDIYAVKALLGHADIRMSFEYIDEDHEENHLMEVLEKADDARQRQKVYNAEEHSSNPVVNGATVIAFTPRGSSQKRFG